ncbi:MAG TPA: hypothetical protein VF043_29220 [Ktedonobacteraceae bacterium]
MWTSKIGRAKQLKEGLEHALHAFFASQPYKIDTKTDPQSKRLIYHVTKVDEVPDEIALITGDIIQNLRSSLDHLAYQLFTLGPGNGTNGRRIYFPIADTAAEYKQEKKKKTEGMTQQAKGVIDTIKPYRGGNDTLWKIHKLNNIDKHRLLVTVVSSLGSVDLGAHTVAQLRRESSELNFPDWYAFFRPAGPYLPMKVGDELLIDAPDAEPIPTMQFRIQVVIYEPGIVEGEPVLDLLQAMFDSVTSLVPIFAPLLTK